MSHERYQDCMSAWRYAFVNESSTTSTTTTRTTRITELSVVG